MDDLLETGTFLVKNVHWMKLVALIWISTKRVGVKSLRIKGLLREMIKTSVLLKGEIACTYIILYSCAPQVSSFLVALAPPLLILPPRATVRDGVQ